MDFPRLSFCFVFIALLYVQQSSGLSCFCGEVPCEFPQCCASGQLTTDSCGCCPVCAKDKRDSCGGPWNVLGLCSRGLKCLKQCECKAEFGGEDRDCIFPFTYKGKTYTSCTTDNSENGKPWCALAVDRNNVALDGQWADCLDGCPGTKFPCSKNDLFQFEGQCVDSRNPGPRPFLPHELSTEVSRDSIKTIDVCATKRPGARVCECVKLKKDDPAPRQLGEGCTQSQNGGSGWCFLTHVPDPNNPSRLCFPDAQWSESHGRFWSKMGCEGLDPENLPAAVAGGERPNQPPPPPPQFILE